MSFSICHGQEHGASHVHVLILSHQPYKIDVLQGINQEILMTNHKYETQYNDKIFEFWIVDPTFDNSMVVRRLLRILDVYLVDSTNSSEPIREWMRKFKLQGDKTFEIQSDSALNKIRSLSDLERITRNIHT